MTKGYAYIIYDDIPLELLAAKYERRRRKARRMQASIHKRKPKTARLRDMLAARRWYAKRKRKAGVNLPFGSH